MTQRTLYLYLAVMAGMGFSLVCLAFEQVDLVQGDRKIIFWCAVGVLAVWLSSPCTMYALRESCEKVGKEMPVFDLKNGSWAFLIGDTVVIPMAMLFALKGWVGQDQSYWSESYIWLATTFAAGLLAGTIFHLLDGIGYKAKGAAAALSSPTKLAHDFVAYPVLCGGLVYGGVPLLFQWSIWSTLCLGCVVVWLLLAVCDALRGLDPKKLHPAWDKVAFVALRWV